MIAKPVSAADSRAFHRAILSLGDLSRRCILRRRARGFRKRMKPDASYVTDADLETERVLRAGITRRFPDHGIIGEELPARNPGAEFQWILDPIDGTLSFTHGIPFYGTIIGLQRRGRPVAGLIDHPGLGLRYSAAAGLGSYRNGERLRIRDLRAVADLEREVIAVGDRSRFLACGSAGPFDALMRRYPVVRGYADCLGHTLAAEGAVAAMVDYGIKLWDISATQLLCEEAGGAFRVTHESRKAGLTLYGIVCGKPKAVAALGRLFSK